MDSFSALGDRMKGYEQVTRLRLPRRTYTILRLDGRSFHSYTKGCDRPFDFGLMADMDAVAEAVAKEVSGSVLAYTQSDEISLLVTDFATPQTQAWFDGQVQKMVSVAASLASGVMNLRRYEATGRLAQFDARVFTLSDPVEVANYFVWRQRDCVRNSVSMAGQAVFSHRELQGVTSGQLREKLLAERGIDWEDYPVGAKRGRVALRVTREEEVTFTRRGATVPETVQALRSSWVSEGAPVFTAEPGGFLAGVVPALPQLSPAP